MAIDQIPIVDLRLLSQEELKSLSDCSGGGDAAELRRWEEMVVPKIDRAVFNESTGGRKQTYSRLRLARTDSTSEVPTTSSTVGRRRRRGRPARLPSSASAVATAAAVSSAADASIPADDAENKENKQIVFFIRQLFAKRDGTSSPPDLTLTPTVDNGNGGGGVGVAVDEELERRERETLSRDGKAVDVAGLAEKVDPFGPEFRKRTGELRSEEELLEYLNGLEGQWGSRRKRRKIVDAGDFGDELPKGWKLILGLKRKEGHVWLDCRRYVSPNGKQFVSCKDVSSYLLSLTGTQCASRRTPGRGDGSILENPGSASINHTASLTNQFHDTNKDYNNLKALPDEIIVEKIVNPLQSIATSSVNYESNGLVVINNDKCSVLETSTSKSIGEMVDPGVAGHKQNLEGNENDGNMKCSALDISTGASPNKCSGHLEFDSKGNSSDDNKIEKTAETNSTSGNPNVGLDAELSISPGTGNATCGSSNVRVPVLGIMDHEIEESGEELKKILKDCSSTPPKGMISVTGCLASDVSPTMEEHFPVEVDRYENESTFDTVTDDIVKYEVDNFGDQRSSDFERLSVAVAGNEGGCAVDINDFVSNSMMGTAEGKINRLDTHLALDHESRIEDTLGKSTETTGGGNLLQDSGI
ncbi:Methyl-CpG-binding domain-containing protein 8 [Acorus gramineus]|uniref:Methyl-CpG-binding domain-containing protein 8 n=1 Tax=Acorus gramineus TaxID=55184 RepID=A0AAV9A4L5_ACOGR|nr:Methyl-CpG-binding domain-containing protein 8 [Acorus gramineus]